MCEGISQLVAMIRPSVIVEEWLKKIKEDGHDAAHPSRSLSIPADNVLEFWKQWNIRGSYCPQDLSVHSQMGSSFLNANIETSWILTYFLE